MKSDNGNRPADPKNLCIPGFNGISPLAEGGPVCIFRSRGPPLGVNKTWVQMMDHGSNSGKQFSKWPPEAIPKNLYVNIFLVGQFSWMIKMSSMRFFRVLHLLEGVLK